MTKLVRPQKISDQVLAVLEERIATGIYEEGSKLPPERTLAEEFGVSRPSVRVALNILIAKQVLEARQGDGYYVSVKPQQDFLQSWQDLLGKHTNWETDVFDFSCHVEGCMAALAAERRTDADLKRIDFGGRNLKRPAKAEIWSIKPKQTSASIKPLPMPHTISCSATFPAACSKCFISKHAAALSISIKPKTRARR